MRDGGTTKIRLNGERAWRAASRFRVFVMLAPALVVIGGLFVGGLVLALAQSLGYFPAGGENAFTFRHYQALLFDEEFLQSLLLTFVLASVATIISAGLGLALALALREVAGRHRFVGVLLQIPLAMPHLVVGVILINFIAPSGFIARLAFAVGLISLPADFPLLTNDAYGFGIISAYVIKETPFIALMTLAVLLRTGQEYELAARTLGANRRQRLRYVTLPLVAPAVVSSALLVLAFIFGAFEIPFLLGRTYPAMLSVVAQRRFTSVNLSERPDALAVAVCLALVATLLVYVYMRLARVLIGTTKPTMFT